MENPFPGMNPYLENPQLWPGVHTAYITYLNAAINRELPDEFATRMEARIFIEDWGKEYGPDTVIVQTRPSPPSDAGNVAVLERPATESGGTLPVTMDFGTRVVRQMFIEIRLSGSEDELVTVIELVSPTNKERGIGREEYGRKQRDIIGSLVNLVEIDLLRGGPYVLAPPEVPLRARFGHFDYLISVHRGTAGSRFELYPLSIREPLPLLRIPLTEDAGDITVDLQAVINRVYEEAGIGRSLHYNEDPVPPLTGEDAAWADALLREKGLRQ